MIKYSMYIESTFNITFFIIKNSNVGNNKQKKERGCDYDMCLLHTWGVGAAADLNVTSTLYHVDYNNNFFIFQISQ